MGLEVTLFCKFKNFEPKMVARETKYLIPAGVIASVKKVILYVRYEVVWSDI